MAYILLDKNGRIPSYNTDKEMDQVEVSPRQSREKLKHSDEFYTKLDDENLKRIESREKKRKEDGKWMIYDRMSEKRLVPRKSDEDKKSHDLVSQENVKSKYDDKFYTRLDEESDKRIKKRENKRQEDAKWMIYENIADNKAVPVIGKSSRRGSDYIKQPLERPYHREPEMYRPPEGHMDDITSYKNDYTGKRGLPANAIRHDGQPLESGKFQGEPTYTTDYKPWQLEKQQAYGAKDSWQPPTVGMAGETTMKHDYHRHQQAKREALRPMEAPIRSDQPFPDRTGYRDEYHQHPLQAKYQRDPETYRPPDQPMDGLTTNKRDYTGPYAAPTRSFKPDNEPFSSGYPLDGNTTQRSDYIKHSLEKPHVHHYDTYKKPDGEFYGDTSYNTNYIKMPLSRNPALKPVSANVAKGAPFNDTTNYNQDYRQWALQKSQPRARDEYHPNPVPFDGVPTYKAHYTQQPLHPAQSYRPDNQAFQSNARLEDGTVYRTDYVKKPMAPCPCVDPHNMTSGHTCAAHYGDAMSPSGNYSTSQMRPQLAVA